ncbi:MAG: hypothetical protein JWQ11_4194 [Rhizobacter sp.]|nr:hypothetical protein [Rhizobacter sp.]
MNDITRLRTDWSRLSFGLDASVAPDWARSSTAFDEPVERLRREGFCVLDARTLAVLAGQPLSAFDAALPFWDDLPPDDYLKDGGRYRNRRHGSFVQRFDPPALQAVPHRAHWQPTTYNALHGGMERWFAPLRSELLAMPFWAPMISALGDVFAQASVASTSKAMTSEQADPSAPVAAGRPPWFVEAHQFRIDTAGGVGRPTPEGAHRDGVDFVAVVLIARHAIRGGETRVFEIDGERGVRFTLSEPWSVLLLDDRRVIHESTPVQPDHAPGHRDTLVVTYRSDGFMDPVPG